ncbi:helicase associated domain-containing protein [Microbacterium sp. NPDC079995]|uniref:helicase associated domain-containing protein n=1 Tax=unclassified Microbacterium TaxID=2609290 RepID=UPI003450C7DE
MNESSAFDKLLAEYLAIDPTSPVRQKWATRCRELFVINSSASTDERVILPQALVNWIHYQRTRKHLSKMEIDCLNAVPGWSWGEREDKWHKTLGEVREFMDTHGRPPRSEGTHLLPGEQSLGGWLKRQREALSKQTLTARRKKALDELPLPWARHRPLI